MTSSNFEENTSITLRRSSATDFPSWNRNAGLHWGDIENHSQSNPILSRHGERQEMDREVATLTCYDSVHYAGLGTAQSTTQPQFKVRITHSDIQAVKIEKISALLSQLITDGLVKRKTTKELLNRSCPLLSSLTNPLDEMDSQLLSISQEFLPSLPPGPITVHRGFIEVQNTMNPISNGLTLIRGGIAKRNVASVLTKDSHELWRFISVGGDVGLKLEMIKPDDAYSSPRIVIIDARDFRDQLLLTGNKTCITPEAPAIGIEAHDRICPQRSCSPYPRKIMSTCKQVS